MMYITPWLYPPGALIPSSFTIYGEHHCLFPPHTPTDIYAPSSHTHRYMCPLLTHPQIYVPPPHTPTDICAPLLTHPQIYVPPPHTPTHHQSPSQFRRRNPCRTARSRRAVLACATFSWVTTGLRTSPG